MTHKLIKNNVIVTIFVSLGLYFGISTAALAGPSDDFVTTWLTTNDNETLYIPVAPSYFLNGGSYNYDVDWDNDGIFDELGLTGAASHVFATAGNHTIRIQGSYPGINYAYNQNILAVEQWGTGIWESMQQAFLNVSNLVINATDTPNLSVVTNMYRMFEGTTSFNQNIGSWNVSSVTNMSRMFYGTTSFNQDIGSWDVSNVTNMSTMLYNATSFNQDISSWDISNVISMPSMFYNATSFNQDIGAWDISNVTSAHEFLRNVTLSTNNYDSLLIGWSSKLLKNNVSFSAGNSQYCAETAQVAKVNMENISGWNITDGGLADASCKSETLVFNDVTLSVDENSAIGTVVGTVQATAPLGNVLTYKILPSLRSNYFVINPSTGEMTTRFVINYETINSFSLNVQVDNGDGGVATLVNTAAITIDVNDLDDTAPVLSIMGLADGSQTSQVIETFSGSIDEAVTLTINGAAVTVEADLTFSHDVTLTEGFNTVTIVAIDLAGNTTTNTRNITLFTGIELVSETISEDTIWGLTNSNYLIRGIITVESGVTLTIEPGTIIKGSSGQLLIDGGALVAEGTASDKIIFTSFEELTPAVNDWSGVLLQQDAIGDFKHVVIQYANVAIYAKGTSSVQISNAEIYNNVFGVYAVDNSVVNVEDTELYLNSIAVDARSNSQLDMSGGRIFANDRGLAYGSRVYDPGLGQYIFGNTDGRIEGVEIFANTGTGLSSQSTKIIDARGNWWGAVDGPSGVGGGSGDAVSGNVLIWDADQRILTQGSTFNFFDGRRYQGYGDFSNAFTNYGIAEPSSSVSPIKVRDYFEESQSYSNYNGIDLNESMNANLSPADGRAVLPVNNNTLNYIGLDANADYTLMLTPHIPSTVVLDDPCNYYSFGLCFPEGYDENGYNEQTGEYYEPAFDANNYISEQHAFSPLTLTSTVGFNSGPASIAGSLSQTTYKYQFNATEEIDLTVYVENWDGGGDVQLEKAALEKVFLVENKTDDLSSATFDSIQFNDKDGDGLVSIGDEYHFQFSKPVDSQLILDGTADADQVLHPAGDASYGNSNTVYWSGDQSSVIIRITEGFSITGDEIITLTGLADKNSNAVMGSQQLTLLDTIAPQLIGFNWDDLDSNQEISIGDNYIFHFDEAMDTSVITDGTATANSKMLPNRLSIYRYGDVNTVSWSPNKQDLTITLTSGFTITGSERVYPHSDVVDVSGNSVLGTVQLIGRDTTPPLFTQVEFNDNDANDVISLGDSYTFSFNEPMHTGFLLNNTTAANTKLSPEGKLYGDLNTIEWNTQGTEVTITVTDGFTITGGEVVTPSSTESLYDLRFNKLSNTVTLPAITVAAIDVVFDSQLDGTTTSQPIQTISGHLTGSGTLTINGTDVTVGTDLSFNHDITLMKGENTITVIATDLGQATKSIVLTIILELSKNDFVTTWQTTLANETITIPTIGVGYNYEIDWNNDGYFEQVGATGDVSHDYATAGIHTIRIRGSFPRIFIANGAEKYKIKSVEQWGNGVWASMGSAFYGASYLVVNATDSPNLSSVTDMSQMFESATNFNSDISAWDVSNVVNMNFMFHLALNFNQDIGAWDVSNVSNMIYMFSLAVNFNQDIGAWDVSNVTDMSHMFDRTRQYGSSFYQVRFNQDISSWNVSNVTNMQYMFYDASHFNQDIGSWDVSRVYSMNRMFYGATSFNQDISSWNVSNVLSMNGMFLSAGLSVGNYDALLNGWGSQGLRNLVSFHGGSSKYCSVAAQAARAKIISVYGWTIADGGLENVSCNPITMDSQSFSLDENAVDGSSVGTVQATQIDSQALSYSITAGNINNAFAINSTTGEITVNTGSELDYESRNTYLLTVQAVGGIPLLTKTAIITINLNDIDDSKPIIIVTTPLENSKTSQTSQTVAGSLDEVATLTINGETVTVEADLSFSHDITLVEGVNTITLIATDAANNIANDSVTVTLDTTEPVITIVSPTDNSTVLQSLTIIFGQLNEAGTLTINGESVTVEADFSFSHPVALLAGSNVFTLNATDTVSNLATATLTVILDDQTAPTITLLNLIDGTVTNQSEQVISGSLNEPGTVTVNGVSVTVETDLTYSHTLTLTEGENTITIIATDTANNSATEIRTITLDTALPVVTITAPSDGLLTNNLNQMIAGNISESVTLTVNGESTTVEADLTFNHAIELSEGENTVTVTATDVAGNITTQTIAITLDLSAPAITVTSPADGLLTTQAAQTIMGNLAAIGSLTINDIDVTVETDLSFSHAITLTEGENTITLIATDELSNTITQSLNLELDTTAPVITVSSPEDGGFLAQNIMAITGSLNEVAVLTINGESVIFDAELNFTHDISLNEGENTFTLVATDDAGHSTSQPLTVTLDDAVAPTITITSPQDGLVTSQAVHNIIGSLDEAGSITVNGSDITLNNDLSFSHEITLVDGENVFTVVASDAATNTSTVLLNITLDNALPATPVVTSHAISPTENLLAQKLVTITGTREANTSIWINGTEQVALGSDDWTATLTLNEGTSLLSIIAKDAAQNSSAEATVQFKIDTTVPVISNVTPAAILNTIPNVIQVDFTEAGSGLDNANTQLVVVRNAVIVDGSLAINADNLVFTPTQALQEGVYTVRPQLVDIAGNNAAVNDYTFTLDFTPPSIPVLSAYSAATSINVVSFNGTKDSGTAIALNGVEIVAENGNTTWSHQASLVAGSNVIDFTATDSAGNDSAVATATVTFDDTAPGAISLLASANGSGTEINLDWAAYDEFTNGNDIAEYRVYSLTTDFTDTASANLISTVAAGTKTATASNLTRQQTVFFAVVAVDVQGNVLTNVTAVSATPADTTAPTNVADFNANSFADNLQLSWTSLSATVNDLAAYKLYIDGAATGIELGSAITTHDLNGLTAATGYTLRLTAVDNDGNENAGVTINAATLLSNPAITSTESLDGLVSLTWDHSQPHALVTGYNIYAETSDFGTSIEGLTAKTTVAANKLQASAFNLNNETQYWLAVSAVNISGGETKLVTTTIAVPTPDSQGPEITNILFDGQALIADQTITASGQIAVTATDRTGISRIELLLDGSVIGSESNASSGSYSLPLDILATSDGVHSLTLRAVDTLGNESDQVISVNVALAPPSAPTLSQPVADTSTNQQQLTISGQADLHTQVKIYNNGSVVGTPITVNEQGIFSLNINLVEGANVITTTAEYPNRGGDSASSASRTITLDQSVPDAPSGFTAISRILGEVRLSWNSVADPRVQGYNIYRSITPFESSSELGVEKLNTLFITDEGYTDLPANNGVYYYRVTSANELGSQSTSSQQVSAESDSLGPRALSIVYIPDGNIDIDSGRVAPGLVDVEITFDEALRNVPYFALTPDGGIPIVINMIKDRSDGRIYKGNFVLQNSTPSGAAFAILTAHDEYGNRGTEIDSGGSILIDTSGPDVLELTLNPTNPIQVDPQLAVSARTIDISVRLNEAVADGFQPRLIPQLDGVVLQGYGDGISLSRDAGSPEAAPVWTGQFILPASAGQNTDGSDGVQVLSFSHSAFDDLDNESTKIQGLNQFQIYQGDLPPVGIPFGLTAKAVADGNVELNWQSVEEASGYKLYRQAFNETQMTELTVLAGAATVSYTDIGLADGLYQYAIASTRSANSQLSESGLSEAVTVIADGTKPNAPQNLQLELNGAGTVLRWLAPTGEVDLSKITYNLYRLPIVEGDSIDLQGVTPLQTNIPNLADPIALDKQPDRNARTYVITAVDAAGNESIESNAVTQAIVLLPVSNLAISLQEEAYPHLTWTHTDNTVQGYDVYVDSISEENKLNTIGMVTDTFFTDNSYNSGSPSNGAELQRHYIVVAIDDQATRSIGHSLVLPALNVALNNTGSQQLDRGIMNNLVFRVDNKGNSATQNQRLLVTIDDDGTPRQHQSNSFSVDAGSFTLVSVVVGGYTSLNNLGELQLQLYQMPQAGEQVTIAQSDSIAVGDNVLSISLTTEDFTRGATGKARFTIENNSSVETELLIAKSNGNQATPEIRLIIEDLEGNTLSTQAIKQFGGGAITTTNGNTVARIAAGDSFTSDLIEIAIPGASPDQIQLRLEIDSYHYHLDRSDHVQIKGSEIRKTVALIDTQYYAQITNISDSVVYGSQPITITGQSIDRETVQPLAGVDVKLVFRVSGFERSSTLQTDSNGQFTYVYTPANNESGRYQVSAIHPDVIDRPNHGEFIIQIVNLSPQQINLNIPKNYDQTLNIRVTAGKETSLSNLRLEYVAEDQINGIKPEGISLSSRAGINVTANSTAYLQPVFRAEPSAQANGIIRLRVVSDDNLALQLGLVTVNYTLSAAEPSLFIGSPGYIETGVGLDKNITEKLTVSNKGLAGLHNIQLTLTEVDGTTPAPNWLYLSSGTSLGDLNVGESETINITFNPSSAIAEADYEYRLKISSDELGDRLVAVYVAVTQSGKGNAFFHTSDIYTATLDDFGSPIPGLAGAKIKLQNEQVLTQQYEVTADANGEALFADIPAGRYIFRASAPDHQDVSGRLVIKPGITVVEEVFLMNQIITVEFSVNEITIQDKYEIILKAIYETSVPVAVVIAEPQSINLPVMKKGETLLGEIRLTNYGLIRAYDLRSVFPQSNELIKFELLYQVPESIDAGEVITLPYRITALSDFDPETDGAATGGGCGNFQFLHCLPNTCVCANGAIVHNQTCTVFYANWGICSGGTSAGGAGGITQYYAGGATGGSSGTVIKGAPQSITHTEPECALSGGTPTGNSGGDDPKQCN